jgi:hypothetical protein
MSLIAVILDRTRLRHVVALSYVRIQKPCTKENKEKEVYYIETKRVLK